MEVPAPEGDVLNFFKITMLTIISSIIITNHRFLFILFEGLFEYLLHWEIASKTHV